MIARIRRTIPLAMGLLALTSTASTVLAQGNIFNPYGNSGYADYREFGRPGFSSSASTPSMPGQALRDSEPIISRPRANSFQQFSDELNGVEVESRTARGRSLPGESHFQAYQRMYNSRYNRVYRPNDTKENREFEQRMKQRDALYAKAMAEKDPTKRAQLLRQVRKDTLGVPAVPTRPKAPAGTSPAPTTRVTPSPGTTRRAPSPYSSSTDRAPSPYTRTLRPGTAGPTTRRAPNPFRALAPDSTAPLPDTTTRPSSDPSSVPIPPPR